MGTAMESPPMVEGRFTRRDFRRIGSVPTRDGSRLSVVSQVIHHYAPSVDRAYFVRIEVTPPGESGNEEVSALGVDECNSMIQVLDYLLASSEELRKKPLEFECTEVSFCTDSGTIVGFSQMGNRQVGYFYVREDSPYGRAFFEVSGLRDLKMLLNDALELLQSLGASQAE